MIFVEYENYSNAHFEIHGSMSISKLLILHRTQYGMIINLNLIAIALETVEILKRITVKFVWCILKSINYKKTLQFLINEVLSATSAFSYFKIF